MYRITFMGKPFTKPVYTVEEAEAVRSEFITHFFSDTDPSKIGIINDLGESVDDNRIKNNF